jgi:hypothetical protein
MAMKFFNLPYFSFRYLLITESREQCVNISQLLCKLCVFQELIMCLIVQIIILLYYMYSMILYLATYNEA